MYIYMWGCVCVNIYINPFFPALEIKYLILPISPQVQKQRQYFKIPKIVPPKLSRPTFSQMLWRP